MPPDGGTRDWNRPPDAGGRVSEGKKGDEDEGELHAEDNDRVERRATRRLGVERYAGMVSWVGWEEASW